MKELDSGGGWQAVYYVLRKARQVGVVNMWRAMRSRNACKTCAVGMGGQRGGMVNESGSFPEVCKKSLQAMAADMQGGISESFWSTYSIPQLQAFSPRDLEHVGRLVQPVVLMRGDDYFRPIEWADAIDRITSKLKQINPSESFWYFSGRSSNEAAFLLQLFARIYGTNNVNNCSYYCHQASGVGLSTSIGSGTATISLEDLEQSDLVFLIGGNPASNHPRLMTSLAKVRRRGGSVIVINPVVETGLVRFRIPSQVRSMLFGTEIASQYVQPDIGGDLGLLTGIAKRILELGRHDESFLRSNCHNVDDWLTQLRALSWKDIESNSGVSKAEIDKIAETYAAAKHVVFSWTMGITHHAHGVQSVQAITNLALMRGMVGRPHSGLMPIRGHSNVQGIGSVGVTPKLKEAIFDRLENHFQVKLPTEKGRDTLECLEGAARGELRAGICLGGNLFGASPEASFAKSAFGNMDQIVYLNTTLNTGHAHGLAKETIILPVLARDEEPESTTQESMFNFVRLSDGGPARHSGPKSEVQVVASIAQQTLGDRGPINWGTLARTGQIREVIANVIPGFEQIKDIDKTKREFHIEGRVLHEPRFPTADGKATIHIHSLPSLATADGELRMMTVRSEGQFNTVVYEEEDLYRGQERRDVILMHPDDLAQRGLRHDQRVTISSKVGELRNFLARSFPKIKRGNALMYYPEANVLVPRNADPQSKTPAFKDIRVRVNG